jgi:aspartate/methionine/tyrosine aminotransferase
MKIEKFEMERMQSTWENLVEYDMSESGILPLSLNELVEMGLDLAGLMDMPLGYSQSNGTPELKELLTKHYPGATQDNIEVTNGTSEANYLLALSQLQSGDEFALEIPNYMQMWGVPPALGAKLNTFRLCLEQDWEPDWDEFDRAVTPKTRMVYISHPNNPTGKVISQDAMERIVARCEEIDAYLVSDEVYLGAEIDRPRTKSFWGMSEKVIVTSGLSKAYGIPGIRIGWIVGPPQIVHDCWSQHDYITIGPNKLSDFMARIAVTPENREKCYARTREVLKINLPLMQQWVDSFGGGLQFRPPDAGAIALIKYDSDIPSYELTERIRKNQSTLIVPGSHLGLEGYIRIWMGGKGEFITEGFRRVGIELKRVL